MGNIQIASCQEQDLEEIFYLENLVFGHERYELLVLRQFYDICGELFIVAKNPEGKIVGHIIGSQKINTLDAWILALAVDPSYRNQGIARKLISHLLSYFRQMKMNYVFLTVNAHNNIAINLYLSLDFKHIASKTNYFGNNSPRNIMRKDLF